MKNFLISIAFIFINSCYASIDVILQPNPVELNQEVKLILKQQGSKQTQGIPDISLLSQDFQVLGTQQSMSYQIINGVSQHENIWTIILLPKHIGEIKIPSLTVGGEITSPQILKVIQGHVQVSNDGFSKEEPNVFMEWQFEPKEPVLHEQVSLRLRIFHAMPLLDAKLSLPRVSNGILFSLEDSNHEVILRNGKKYEIETYEYLIYPQKTGKMVIHSPVLDALEYDLIPAPVHAYLPNKVLEVSLLPTKNQDLMPAKRFFYQELTPKINNISIAEGDTFTRRIQFTALGVPKNFIEDLNSSCGKSCKVYVHTVHSSNKIINKELHGSKVFEITYLPEKKGYYDASEMKVNWFNTSTRTADVLTIPGIKISVAAPILNERNSDAGIILKTSNQSGLQIPTWLSILLGLSLGIVSVFVYRFLKWPRVISWFKQLEFKDNALKKACFTNNPSQARLILLKWAKKNFPDTKILDLHDVLNLLEESSLKNEIKVLMMFLYDKQHLNKSWSGKELWLAFKRINITKKRARISENNLNSLNP